MRRVRFQIAALTALLLILAPFASGQVQTGRIVGTVFDPQNNVVPGAKVTVRSMDTSAVYRAESDKLGAFVVPGLQFGLYTVTIEASGFRRWETNNVRVITSQDANVKAVLEIGQVSEVVNVESGQQVINTTSAELQSDINRRQVIDLPLVTRNPIELVGLQAGVITTTNTRNAVFNGLRGRTNNITQDGINVQDNFVRTGGFFAISAPSVENTGEFSISTGTLAADSGAGVGQVHISTPRGTNDIHGSLFYFHRNDALNANTFFNNLTDTPKERLRQHRFGGRVGGPVYIPHVWDGRDKSFFFFRYEGFRENFSQTRNHTVLSQAARQGMFSYVGLDGAQHTVDLLGLSSNAFPINPFTKSILDATPLPNNTQLGDGVNTGGFQFNVNGSDPNNRYTVRIDQKLIQSQRFGTHWVEFAYNWANFTSFPDTFNGLEAVFPAGVATNCIEAVCEGAGQSSKRNVMAVAIQSTLSPTLFNEFRVGYNRAPVGFLRQNPFPRGFRLSWPVITDPEQNFLDQGRITPVYDFIDNVSKVWGTHNFKFGLLISSTSGISFNDGGIIPSISLGNNPSNSDGLNRNNFPGQVDPNTPGPGIGTTDFARAEGIYAGLVGLLSEVDQTFNANPDQGFQPGLTNSNFVRERAFNFYLTDSWRMFPRFTLNYGVRWEIVPAPDQVNRRALLPTNFQKALFFSGPLFQPNPNVTFADILSGAVQPTQLDLAGASNGRPFWATDWNNIAPSLGFAWQPMAKTVIRAGFSVSYTRDGLTVVTQPLSSNDGIQLGAADTRPVGVLDPAANQNLPSPSFDLPVNQLGNWLSSGANSGMFTFDPNLRTPYVLQWSFGIEREVSPTMAFSVFYVGNHAVKLYRGIDYGQVDIRGNGMLDEFNASKTNLACNRSFQQSGFADRGHPCNVPTPILTAMDFPFFTSGTFVNPLDTDEVGQWVHNIHRFASFFYFDGGGQGLFQGLGSFPANFFRSNPFVFFDDAIGNHSTSRFDSLQLEFRRRMSRGLMFQANYTFGKVLTDSSGDAQNTFDPFIDLLQPRYDRTRADFDVRHTFNFLTIWELPVGSHRRFLSNVPVLSKALEGWQIGGIWQWHSGRPVSILSGRGTLNRSARSSTKNAAVLLGGLTPSQVCSAAGVNKTDRGVLFFPESFVVRGSGNSTLSADTSMFTNPGAAELGAQGLVNGCSGPSYFRVDMNVVKRTQITERVNFEFRAEFFNIFNNTNFATPVSGGNSSYNINNPGFGTITSLNGGNGGADSRQIQFNFRINW